MSHIFAIGELLIDMVGIDHLGLKDGIQFEKKAGGAPANVCAAITRLGGSSSFLGQVGKDPFGDFLLQTLQEYKVDTSFVKQEGSTTMAFVGVDTDGERSFTFLRGSDALYTFDNIDTNKIKANDMIHFGSATALLEGELKRTYTDLLYYAKENHIYISFDPNYRDTLITPDILGKYKKDCYHFMKKADLVKLSKEELFLLTQCNDIESGARFLNDMGAEVILVTLGSDGCLLCVKGECEVIKSIHVKQVDSTGAGDAFMGAILYQLSLLDERKELSYSTWKEIVYFANIVGALTTTQYGAMEGIPMVEVVQDIMRGERV
ncbi:MAG: carbohydrate kinase [Erysipelotrichaceae bacterium]|nr:carbohydrate kinase [Erysipelotrichaceae bacterium]